MAHPVTLCRVLQYPGGVISVHPFSQVPCRLSAEVTRAPAQSGSLRGSKVGTADRS
jgi:hypothetical protein